MNDLPRRLSWFTEEWTGGWYSGIHDSHCHCGNAKNRKMVGSFPYCSSPHFHQKEDVLYYIHFTSQHHSLQLLYQHVLATSSPQLDHWVFASVRSSSISWRIIDLRAARRDKCKSLEHILWAKYHYYEQSSTYDSLPPVGITVTYTCISFAERVHTSWGKFHSSPLQMWAWNFYWRKAIWCVSLSSSFSLKVVGICFTLLIYHSESSAA